MRRILALFRRCPMNPNDIQRQRREDYLTRVKIARSSQPSMTSEQFYAQMERSMGTKMKWITPPTSAVSKPKLGV
jgi:hypothetical protein